MQNPVRRFIQILYILDNNLQTNTKKTQVIYLTKILLF